MRDLLSTPLFGLSVALIFYWCGLQVKKRLSSPIFNPLVISVTLTILLIQLTPVTLDEYQVGGNFIAAIITPATVALAMQMYQYKAILQENFWPIVIGCLAGSLVSIGSVYLMCSIWIGDPLLTVSLLPKSVTTAISLSLAELYGGVGAIAIAGVIFTGIFSAVFSPLLIKLFHLQDSVAIGAAIGTSGHALGTTKAVEIGQVEGAISGVCIAIAGLWTTLIFLLLF